MHIQRIFSLSTTIYLQPQRAKKDVFDSPGLVDFAIGVYLMNSVPNLPDGQVQFLGEIQLKEGL